MQLPIGSAFQTQNPAMNMQQQKIQYEGGQTLANLEGFGI